MRSGIRVNQIQTKGASERLTGTILETRKVLGTSLALTSYEDLFQKCLSWREARAGIILDFSNTQIVTMRRHEPPFRSITECVDYFVPDGMPLIWCLNAKGGQLRDRVYGPSFMKHALRFSPQEMTHYFLGGSQECLEKLHKKALEINPALRIVGSHHGYFNESESERFVKEINALNPDMLWIGLGTPKQQQWIHDNRQKLNVGVILAVGFAFDVNAGTKKDAPAPMQRLGLTWLFRLLSEPRRLAPRYFKWNTLFLWYFLCEVVTSRSARS